MSQRKNKPILINENINCRIEGGEIEISGPCGKMCLKIPPVFEVVLQGKELLIKIKKEEKNTSSFLGLFRGLLTNAILGVQKGWEKTLEMVGVGFRAETNGQELILHLGFSHPIKVKAPDGVKFSVMENKIKVSGVDKYLVGETAASIRRIKPPEPYKGKGIRYLGEVIRKKLGKAAKTAGVQAGGK